MDFTQKYQAETSNISASRSEKSSSARPTFAREAFVCENQRMTPFEKHHGENITEEGSEPSPLEEQALRASFWNAAGLPAASDDPAIAEPTEEQQALLRRLHEDRKSLSDQQGIHLLKILNASEKWRKALRNIVMGN